MTREKDIAALRGETVELLQRRRSDVVSGLAVAGHFAAVYAAVYLAAWYGPGWTTLVCWLWFGVLGHGFHQLLHECAHKLTFRRPGANEMLARWFVAPLYFADFEAFRRRHWKHHTDLGAESDPKYTYRIDVRGRRFLGLLSSMLTMIGALRKAHHQVGGRSEATPQSTRRALTAIALIQPLLALSVLLAARLGHAESWRATLLAFAVAYGFVYAYGVASLTVWVATVRGIAEHATTGDDHTVVGEAALRNFSDNLMDRIVFGAYGFSDHATHHRHPGVPAHLLPELTRRLAPRDDTLVPVGTHSAVLARLVSG